MYLIPAEFKRFIQVDNLNQVISNDPSILESAILDAQSVARENLVQKYLIDKELQDISEYDPGQIYTPQQRVYLDADNYDPTLTYVLNDLSLKDGNVYKCSTAISTPEAFTPSHWNLLGIRNSIYYVAYPFPLFDVMKQYSEGDKVFRLGKVYTCQIATLNIDHTTLLQYNQYSTVPLPNVFPEDPKYGLKFWGSGVVANTEVTLPGPVTIPNDFPNGFTAGDNRNRNLVRHLIAITLWIVHDRIAPRNIPELREKRFKMAMDWMHDAKEGNITADIELIQPRSGGRIRWGSNIKNINSY